MDSFLSFYDPNPARLAARHSSGEMDRKIEDRKISGLIFLSQVFIPLPPFLCPLRPQHPLVASISSWPKSSALIKLGRSHRPSWALSTTRYARLF